MKAKTILILSAFAWFTCLSPATAQNAGLRDTLFSQVDATLNVVKRKKAYVLAPESFEKGYRLYKQAEESLQKGKNITSIQRDLDKAMEFFERSLEVAKLGEVTFSSVMKARDDAEKANAREYAKEPWAKAEGRFRDAAEQLEGGDVKDAQKIGQQAEQMYRTAELDAIKGNYLNETKALLEKADDMKVHKYAPKTLQKAKVLLSQAERALTQNRYDIDQPRDLARQAKYEANHAIYLAKRLNEVRERDISMEELILEYEMPLIRIGGAMNIVTELDRGHQGPTEEIISRVERLQADANQMQHDLADMEGKLGNMSTERASLKRLEAQRKQVELIDSMFTRDEASVLRRGDEIILRLVGLNFDVGKADIASKNFGLLAKVQNAIKVFPGSVIVVEGHTDSFGSDSSNLALSQKRAESVRQYMIANMQLTRDTVSAVGYGETRPVANNETPEGRAKNRRIDIVIRPSA